MNCYVCDNTGRAVTGVAVCHGCGVALCREHLDDDLLGDRPQGQTRRSCTHQLHGAAMARRRATLPGDSRIPEGARRIAGRR
jgi:hypothetical protein